ncbi:MAG: glycosyltransferase family 39 protein [Candidatus Omnitrophota bacterium]
MDKKKVTIYLSIIIILGILLRLAILLAYDHSIDGDEACFSLMAKHILTKGEYPIFMWNAHYAGTLQSYFLAIVFFIFGSSGVLFKASMLIFVVFSIYFVFLLTKYIANEKIALLAALFYSFASGYMSRLSIKIYETSIALMLLPLAMLFLCKSIKEERSYQYAILGLTCGILFWLTPTTVPFLFVVVFSLFFRKNRELFFKKNSLYVFFFLIGVSPFILYNTTTNFSSFTRLPASLLYMDRSMIEGSNPGAVIFYTIKGVINSLNIFFLNSKSTFSRAFLVDARGLSIPDIIVSCMYIISLIYSFFSLFKKLNNNAKETYFRRTKVFYLLLFLSLWLYVFGIKVYSHRLFIVYSILPVCLAISIDRVKIYSKKLMFLLVVFLISYNIYSNILIGEKYKAPQLQPLISFLKSNNLYYGYAAYNIVYPVVFESNEDIILSPYDHYYIDRYPYYTKKVMGSKDICYIMSSKEFDSVLFEDKLRILKVQYKKDKVTDFLIYYRFSKEFSFEEVGLLELFNKG